MKPVLGESPKREEASTPEDPRVHRLMALVYEELHEIAALHMRAERDAHTLQATAVVHEAFLRLVRQSGVSWKGREHFLGIAARMVRRILVDHARRRACAKRGGDRARIDLSSWIDLGRNEVVDLLALDEALEDLERLNVRHRQLVELRFFGGLDFEEVARVLGVSSQTARGDWRMARAWLRERLER